MPGWLRSAGSGPLTWMLWNATSTAWSKLRRRKRRQGEDDAAQTANVTKEKRNENQSDQRTRGRPGQGPALLYGGAGLCQENRFQPGPLSLADRGLARGAGRHGATAGAEQQPCGQSVPAGAISTEPARGHVLHRRHQGPLRADQGPRRRVHAAAYRRDRLDHCDAEGHLRQPDSADPTGTLFTLRRKKWAIASTTHRVRPAARRCERTQRSGPSFSSESCATRQKKSGRRLLTQRICASGRLSTPMGAWARLEPR